MSEVLGQTAFVIVQRHGQKEKGVNNETAKLTPTGVRQVTESFNEHIRPLTHQINIQTFVCSELVRTKQTVLAAINEWPYHRQFMEPIIDSRFGYQNLPGEEALMKDIKSFKSNPMVIDWFNKAPTWTCAARDRVTEALRTYASIAVQRSYLSENGDKIPAVYVGSHAPVFELACLNPYDTPSMNEADIIIFEFVITERETLLRKSTHLPSGF